MEMKIYFYFFILLGVSFIFLTPSIAVSQEMKIEWIRQFGTLLYDNALRVSIDSTGVYVTGHTDGTLPGQSSAGGSDIFIRKYDFDGNEIWTRQFGSIDNEVAPKISVNSTGVYVTGSTSGTLPGQSSAGGSDTFIRKYDFDGNEIWTRQFGSSSSEQSYGISTDSTGVYVTGTTLGIFSGQTSAGGTDVFIRKYNFNGNEIWTRQFGTSLSDGSSGISAHSTTGIYIAGHTEGTFPGQVRIGGQYDSFIRKYDSNGNEIWMRQFGTSLSEQSHGVSDDSTGVYVTGHTDGIFQGQLSIGEEDAFIRKYDFDGNEIWTRQFGTSVSDYGMGAFTYSTSVYVVGHTYGTFPNKINEGLVDLFVRRYDLNGNEILTHQFGTINDDFFAGVVANSTGIYTVGLTSGALPGQINSGSADAFVIKFFSDLRQSKSDEVFSIIENSTTTESTVVFKVFLFDSENDQIKLQIELKEFNQPFDETNLLESSFVSSGSEVSIIKENLADGQYHWRVRAVDINDNASDWQEFGEAGNVDFEVKTVPLYTQGISPYPSDEKTRSWYDEPYANGGIGTYSCAKYDTATIARCGCAITSSVMISRYYGINAGIDGQDVNPKNINDWLNTNNGYNSAGNLKWDKISEYSKSSLSGLARLHFDGIVDSKDTSTLDIYAQSLRPAILQHKTLGHFFVADGKLTNTYTIKDPAWYNTKNLNDTRVGSYIRNYNNHFDGLRLFSALPTSLNDIYLNLASPAEFLIIDPQGRKLGKDPISGIAYNEIPGGVYFQEGISDGTQETPPPSHESKNIWIPDPVDGQYAVNVIGTDAGSYTFESLAYDAQSQSHSQTLTGNTQSALVSEYNLNFTPNQPENINIQLISESLDECPTLSGGNIGCPAKIDFLSEEKISNSAELPELFGPQGEIRYTAPVVEGQRGTTEVKTKLYNEAALLNLLGNLRNIPLDQLCAIFDDASKDGALTSRLIKATDSAGKFSFGVSSLTADYALIESVRETIAGQSKRVCILETIKTGDFDNSGIASREVNQISLTVRRTHTGDILVKKTAGHNSQTISE